MDFRRKLFLEKDPYCLNKTKEVFLDAVRQSVAFHKANCAQYAGILEANSFSVADIHSEEDLYKIPVLPTLYFKRNHIFSVPEEKLKIKATSSGTKGVKSNVGFDRETLFYGIFMMLRFFSYHKITSLLPVNYIVLGYEPSKHTQMGAIKTAYCAS